MAATSKFTFVVHVDGKQGKKQAAQWAKEIQQHMAGIAFDLPELEIKGLEQAKKDVQALSRAAAKVGKALFQDADKQVELLDERLSRVKGSLAGILSTPERADWMDKFASDVEQAATASGRMVTTIARWKQEMEKADAEVQTIQQRVSALSQQRLFPAESGLRVTVGEYATIADLVERRNERLAQGRDLSKADLATLQKYEQTMASVVNFAEQRTIEEGRISDLVGTWGQGAARMKEMVAQYRQLQAEQLRAEKASRSATKKLADAMGAKELVLPAEAQGNLADMTRAMQILGEAAAAVNKEITSQTRRLGSYQKRLEAVLTSLLQFAEAQQKMGQGYRPGQLEGILGAGTGGPTATMGREAEATAERTESAFQRMYQGVTNVLRRLRRDQKGTFDPLVEDAARAKEEIVEHSYIPDMVRDVLHWLNILKEDEETVFVPLIRGAQYTRDEVNKALAQMRYPHSAVVGGEKVGGQYASKDDLIQFFSVVGLPPAEGPGSVAGYIEEQERFVREEIDGYQQTLDRLAQAEKEQERILRQLGTTKGQWAQMGEASKWAAAIQSAQTKAWGVRSLGSEVASWGRGMTMASGAALGAAALAGKQYLELNDPLERAARNLELNASLTEDLDRKLRTMAGTLSALQASEQAELLFTWAAATGAQVDSQAELNEVLGASLDLQKMVKIGYVDEARAVEIVTDVQSQFDKSLSDTEDIIAKLVTVAARSKADIDDLGGAFGMVGTQADEFNTSFEETAGALNILSAYAQRGSRAGTGLARLLENLVAPSETARNIIEEMFDPTRMQTAEGQFIGLSEAVALLADETADLTEVERQRFFAQITSANATRVLLPLIDMQLKARERNINAIRAEQKILDGRVDAEVEAYIQLRQEVSGYEISTKSALDTLDDQWAQYTTSLTGRADLAKARWSAMIDTMGKQVVTTALPYLDELLQKVSGLVSVAEDNPDLVRAALQGTAVVAGVGALVTALGKGITLYADVAMITAAATMKAAADEMLVASGNMQVAGGGGWLPSAGGLAIGVPAGMIGGEVASRKLTGKGLYDLFSTKEETWQAIYDSERQALDMEEDELRGVIAELKAERARLEEWRKPGFLLFGGAEKWKQLPDQYKDALGLPSGKLLDEQWAKVDAYLDAYQQRVQALAAEEWYAKQREHTAQVGAATESMETVVQATQAVGRATSDVVGQWRVLVDFFHTAVGKIQDMAAWGEALRDSMGQMYDRVNYTSLGDILTQETASRWSTFTGLVGVMDPAQIKAWGDQYRMEMAELLQGMEGQEQWYVDLAVATFNDGWDERVDKVRSSASKIKEQQDRIARNAEQAWSDWESFAGGLLEPTEVTAEDMALSDVGGYKDKWDEYVRQLRAAQVDMQSVFRKMLPTDVEQAGQDSINAWVEGQIRQFYNGMMPDKVNWDALIADYDKMVEQKLGKNKLLDIFMQKLIESGRTPDEYAAKKTLGMESPIKAMWFGGQSPEQLGQAIQADMTTALQEVRLTTDLAQPPADAFVTAMTGGIGKAFGEQRWTETLVSSFSADITSHVGEIKELGGKIGGYIFDGLRAEMRKYSLIDVIASVVIEELAGEDF